VRKTLLALVILIMLSVALPVCAEEAAAIVVPEFTFPDRTYQNLNDTDVPVEELIAAFPAKFDLTYSDGVLTLTDHGYAKVWYTDFCDYNDHAFTLSDGIWSCETVLTEQQFTASSGALEIYGPDSLWSVSAWYSKAWTRIEVRNPDNTQQRVLIEEGDVVTLSYRQGDYRVSDFYWQSTGELSGQEVQNYYKPYQARYSKAGVLTEGIVYVDEDEYVFDSSSGWYPSEPPGYEGVGAELFETYVPCLINGLPEATATPTPAPTATPTPTPIPTPTVIVLPEFEFPEYSVPTLEELNIPIEEIASLFPADVEFAMEDGLLTVTDFGCAEVVYMSYSDYEDYPLTLSDGVWRGSIPDASAAGGMIFLYGENGQWELMVVGGHIVNKIILYQSGNGDYVGIDQMMVYVDLNPDMGEMQVSDRYMRSTGALESHGVYNNVNTWSVYDAAGKMMYSSLDTPEAFYYYFPGEGWTMDYEYHTPCDAPAGYERDAERYFLEACPSFLGGVPGPSVPDSWDVVLPEDLLVIESEAFANLNVESIYIPEGVTTIEAGAFAGCTGLRYIYIPSTVKDFPLDLLSGYKTLIVLTPRQGLGWLTAAGLTCHYVD